MKKRILAAFAALTVTATVHAQSTVDSIAAKYKLLPMPAGTTIERIFPALGTYQLNNATEGTGTLTVTLDSTNKGLVWIEGLPQGRVKAYLRKSPATYRILSQKTGGGKQVSEGTMHFDTTSRNLHIAIGKAYDESDPTGIFALTPDMSAGAQGESEMKIKTNDTKVKTEVEGNQVKVKTKTPVSKTKTKVKFYTAAKIEQTQDTMSNQGNMSDTMSSDNTQTQQSDSTQQSGSTQESGSTQQSDSTQQTQTPQQ